MCIRDRFLFFGVVAVAGSYFVQTERISADALVLAVPIGLLAAAILVVNNIRDIDTDRRAGKRTLAVKLGRARARLVYAAMIGLPFLIAPLPLALSGLAGAWLVIFAAPGAVSLARVVLTKSDGPALNSALAGTGGLLAGYSVLLAAGLLVS